MPNTEFPHDFVPGSIGNHVVIRKIYLSFSDDPYYLMHTVEFYKSDLEHLNYTKDLEHRRFAALMNTENILLKVYDDDEKMENEDMAIYVPVRSILWIDAKPIKEYDVYKEE